MGAAEMGDDRHVGLFSLGHGSVHLGKRCLAGSQIGSQKPQDFSLGLAATIASSRSHFSPLLVDYKVAAGRFTAFTLSGVPHSSHCHNGSAYFNPVHFAKGVGGGTHGKVAALHAAHNFVFSLEWFAENVKRRQFRNSTTMKHG